MGTEADRDLEDTVKELIDGVLSNIHTTMPGIVVSFDPGSQLASVQPVFNRELKEGVNEPYPKLINVPMLPLQAGGYCITLPVKSGNECILFFCQRAYDLWVERSEQGVPLDFRKFDLSDAYFLPASVGKKNRISDYSTDNISIRNLDNTQRIDLKPDGVVDVITPTKLYVETPLAEYSESVAIKGTLTVDQDCTFKANTTTTGTSTAADHLSNGKSGKDHTHTDSMGGQTTPPL